MRKNFTQSGYIGADGRRQIRDDWFGTGIPSNIQIAEDVYIDSSYGFAGCHTAMENGIAIDNATGLYDRTSFAIGLNARMKIGKFSILNGCNFICNQYIEIGSYCMISWGTYISDSWLINIGTSSKEKEDKLRYASNSIQRNINPYCGETAPVLIDDGAWIGFGSTILPGVKIGKYAVVGCKSVVSINVPAFAVVAGNPARIIKYLTP